jgi:hypothetical protein
MWTTAEAVKGIPDLDQFNESVDKQIEKINTEITRLDEDNYFDNTSENRVIRWEKILSLTQRARDTLDERRFAVHSKVIDKLPYTFRIIGKELNALAPGADFTREMSENGMTATVRLPLTSASKISDVDSLLDRKLPLDVIYTIIIMYHTWDEYAGDTWADMSELTWGEVKAKQP